MRLAFSVWEVEGLGRYELQYEFNALCDAEAVCGANLLGAVERLLGEGGVLSAAQLRGLLYAMIRPYPGFPAEPLAGLKECGNLIRIDTIGSLLEALGEACAVAVSEEYGEKYRAALESKKEQANADLLAEVRGQGSQDSAA